MLEKPAVTEQPIHQIIANRWSPRAYDASRMVSQTHIIALLEAARWAPSCFGEEPWRFLVFDKATNPNAWQHAFDCLAPGNQIWVKNVPLLLLAVATEQFKMNDKPNRWAQYDTGAASENLCLEAVNLGLVTHQMGGFDADKTRTTFQLPDNTTPMAMIAVGYQAAPETLEDDFVARETAERQRLPLHEIGFDGVWGKSIAV